MDKEEAKQIIESELKHFRAKAYSELVELIDSEPVTKELSGPSGKFYQAEVEVFWDDKPGGNIRVLGSIDDGKGWFVFSPLCQEFIKSPSNEFIDE